MNHTTTDHFVVVAVVVLHLWTVGPFKTEKSWRYYTECSLDILITADVSALWHYNKWYTIIYQNSSNKIKYYPFATVTITKWHTTNLFIKLKCLHHVLQLYLFMKDILLLQINQSDHSNCAHMMVMSQQHSFIFMLERPNDAT